RSAIEGARFRHMLAAVTRPADIEGALRKQTIAAIAALRACMLAGVPGIAVGQAASDQANLAPVVVTATRTEQSPFDVPASIDRIGGNFIRDAKPQVNISESLGGVAGLLARDRENYAQDVQISVRGFGARSTFGIRGVR